MGPRHHGETGGLFEGGGDVPGDHLLAEAEGEDDLVEAAGERDDAAGVLDGHGVAVGRGGLGGQLRLGCGSGERLDPVGPLLGGRGGGRLRPGVTAFGRSATCREGERESRRQCTGPNWDTHRVHRPVVLLRFWSPGVPEETADTLG